MMKLIIIKSTMKPPKKKTSLSLYVFANEMNKKIYEFILDTLL